MLQPSMYAKQASLSKSLLCATEEVINVLEIPDVSLKYPPTPGPTD